MFKFHTVFVHACACLCVFANVQVGTGCLPSSLSTFWDGISHWAWNSTIKLDRPSQPYPELTSLPPWHWNYRHLPFMSVVGLKLSPHACCAKSSYSQLFFFLVLLFCGASTGHRKGQSCGKERLTPKCLMPACCQQPASACLKDVTLPTAKGLVRLGWWGVRYSTTTKPFID